MSNKRHTPIKAKPPVDTNKPKFTKKSSAVEYTFEAEEDEEVYDVTVIYSNGLVGIDSEVAVKDIPTLIAVLQDIYSGANV